MGIQILGNSKLVITKQLVFLLVTCISLTSCSVTSNLNVHKSQTESLPSNLSQKEFQLVSQQLLESDLRKSVQSNLIYESETFSGNTNLAFTLSDQNIQEPEFKFANFRGEIELWVICIGDGTIEYSLESVGSEIGVLPQDCKNEMNWQSIGMKIKTPVEEIKISTKLSGNPETYRFAISYSNN